MYRIAICDDEKKELDKTESLVLSWRRRHEDEEHCEVLSPGHANMPLSPNHELT